MPTTPQLIQCSTCDFSKVVLVQHDYQHDPNIQCYECLNPEEEEDSEEEEEEEEEELGVNDNELDELVAEGLAVICDKCGVAWSGVGVCVEDCCDCGRLAEIEKKRLDAEYE